MVDKMGLDLVELVMAIEEEFEIEIDDGDTEELVTVVDLTDYIYFKIRKRNKKNWIPEIAEKELITQIIPLSQNSDDEVEMERELKKLPLHNLELPKKR
jgi:phosphopantetheine binding protein